MSESEILGQIQSATEELSSIEVNLSNTNIKETYFNGHEITKVYNSGVFTLQPMDMEINSSEMTGVVGENGNGKTTLLRIVARDLHETGGSLKYSFQPSTEGIGPYFIKHHIGYIPQRIPRWYGKLEDNLKLALSGRGIFDFENEFQTELVLHRLGLAKFRNLFWTQISSGYRTRFELARIILTRPKLLVLDEPLANLDINAQKSILEDLKCIAKSTRFPMGVFLSSQQLYEVEDVADHIIFLKNGECLHSDSTNSKINADEFSNVFEFQFHQDYSTVSQVMKELPNIEFKTNGNLCVLKSKDALPIQEVLKVLIKKDCMPFYYRDISTSTKRFFNN